ncbi:hypothetical protein [Variovorax arabinosiphilus]|uniref:hypothetical protein n=1 Tax=Variovorax arabinosiphilus TaxID=3053498 RepID=UPI002576D646|nr:MULTISPECIES: hypothetical protein [unclassified Variovorax]MDM0119003.1 hypothetical protein [Variovorax sp. J2L1-78]MDM0129429.1 hypothetical protein [Variovorax sp. J2L1-63]MDM0232785.1 hypothetical protein [Variovorax sp. J2R1-6]
MSTFDAATFANEMAARPKARLAFMDMVWSRRLEPRVIYRRWLNRPESLREKNSAGDYTAVRLNAAAGSTRGPALSGSIRTWVESHAIALEACVAWDQATRQADKSIREQWANWYIQNTELGEQAAPGRFVWFCRATTRGHRFVGYVQDAVGGRFSAGTPTKQQRCDALGQARLKNLRQVEALSSKLCLLWSERDGWETGKGARPDDGDVRRVALLHVGPSTHCWLFKSDERFVARLVGGDVQVAAQTPAGALSGLRSAVVQYRKMYNVKSRAVPKCPVAGRLSEETLARVGRVVQQARAIRGSDAFWYTGHFANAERPKTNAGSANDDPCGC